MGYLLRMSGEIHDWLADLRDSDPSSALLVGEALAALMSAGASLRSPLVVPLADPRPAELGEALDLSYQHWQERLQAQRIRATEAATRVRELKDLVAELQAGELRLDERRRDALDAGRTEQAAELAGELAAAAHQAAEVRRLLPAATEAEDRLARESQRLEERTSAFRTRKEVLKATYNVARTSLFIDEALAASGQEDDSGGSQPEDAGEATTEAAAKLREITEEIERELRPDAWPADLLELRLGPPGDSEMRILFAIEPPGTALLIAVLEGRQAVRDQHTEAVMLSAEMLQRSRSGLAPEAAAHAYDDARSFLEEFYPGNADEVDLGAAALAARNRAHTLAEQRVRLGMTQAEVAQRMGVRQERVSAIERAEPGATEVRTLASYVEALGGLEIAAEFGGERVLLR